MSRKSVFKYRPPVIGTYVIENCNLYQRSRGKRSQVTSAICQRRGYVVAITGRQIKVKLLTGEIIEDRHCFWGAMVGRYKPWSTHLTNL